MEADMVLQGLIGSGDIVEQIVINHNYKGISPTTHNTHVRIKQIHD